MFIKLQCKDLFTQSGIINIMSKHVYYFSPFSKRFRLFFNEVDPQLCKTGTSDDKKLCKFVVFY